jgi:CRISPR-associated endonuclease/helicase Cas3
MAPLFAKSARPGSTQKTLPDHTGDVLSAVIALFGREGSTTRFARSWLRFFGIPESELGRLLRHLGVAAAAHDWGKANDGFQDAVTDDGEQVIRHEHLSGLMLADLIAEKEILTWLRDAGLDEIVLLAAVISHHLKVGRKGEHALGAYMGKRDTVSLFSDHPDFATIWRMIQTEVGPPCPVPLRLRPRWRREDIQSKRTALSASLDRESSRLRDPDRRRWVAAVRAGLIIADAVGSAVVRMDGVEGDGAEATIDRWVRDCFATVLTGEEVWTKITKQRVADLRERGRWSDSEGFAFGDERGFNEYQVGIAEQGPRVLLTAPCGSGKTLAAWNWIKTELDRRPAARVLFLYPTRATATEGFRDYVSWAPEDEAGLLSGTADYELQSMFETPDDREDPRKDRDYRCDPRLYALGHWKKRIFSATADQFFPFMQYEYRAVCHLPLLVESVLVVDEVHSFDKSMFSTLKRFLKDFPNVPVLCMTATLPPERRNDLIDCKLKPYPETPPADLVDDSTYPRYHIEWIDRAQAEKVVEDALNDRKRVLWVSNRVSDCQAAFKPFCGDGYIGPGTIKAYCYHSRFRLDDRKKRHGELIQAFQEAVKEGAPPQGLLGATTQVCEMSLDLDAEILVTELAPIASLIQRMDRCNRDSKKMRRRPIGRVYVLRPQPGKEKPYEKEELAVAERFVNKIAGSDVCQEKLEAIYKECDPREIEPIKVCPFLDSGPYAEAREESFRENDEFTVPCVLDYDVPKVEAAIAGRKPIDGFIIPVPRYPRYLTRAASPGSSRLPRWLSIAEGSRYDKLIGFNDRPRSGSEGGHDS